MNINFYEMDEAVLRVIEAVQRHVQACEDPDWILELGYLVFEDTLQLIRLRYAVNQSRRFAIWLDILQTLRHLYCLYLRTLVTDRAAMEVKRLIIVARNVIRNNL